MVGTQREHTYGWYSAIITSVSTLMVGTQHEYFTSLSPLSSNYNKHEYTYDWYSAIVGNYIT
jgi:hypothetical protein